MRGRLAFSPTAVPAIIPRLGRSCVPRGISTPPPGLSGSSARRPAAGFGSDLVIFCRGEHGATRPTAVVARLQGEPCRHGRKLRRISVHSPWSSVFSVVKTSRRSGKFEPLVWPPHDSPGIPRSGDLPAPTPNRRRLARAPGLHPRIAPDTNRTNSSRFPIAGAAPHALFASTRVANRQWHSRPETGR